MADFIPGGDFIPGVDFLPDVGDVVSGVTDLLGGGTQDPTSSGSHPAAGGSTTVNNITNTPYRDPTISNLTADLTSTAGGASYNDYIPHFADGGYASGEDAETQHNPEFYSEGGLQNRYVQGDGDGTSDSVPAMLATGEFVIPADVVSALGNGSSDSGASVLDQFLASIREHKQDHAPDELPPDSEGPLAYLNKVKA